jgi:outer membrane protein with beta-barrel domain
MHKALLVFAVFLFAGTMAFAQDATPRFDIFGGYSHIGNQGIGLNGWIGSANWNFNRWLGLKGAVSGHYGSESFGNIGIIVPTVPEQVNSREHNFDFGPTFTFRRTQFNAFTHLLFGVSHTNLNAAGEGNGDTAFSWIWGAGADYNITPKFAGRFQADLLRTNFFSLPENHGRVSLGIVYRLGEH